MRAITLTTLATFILSGCATIAGGDLNTPNDVGPVPPDYRVRTETLIRSTLKDPYSAMIDVGEPRDGFCAATPFTKFWGWAVPVSVNAKNSYGGYTGVETGYVWFAKGEPVRMSASFDLCP